MFRLLVAPIRWPLEFLARRLNDLKISLEADRGTNGLAGFLRGYEEGCSDTREFGWDEEEDYEE